MVVVLERRHAKYKAMQVLGIETSCDETAAAVVTDERAILSSVVLSQIEDHRVYGGVVPEIAARAHVEHLDGLIRRAMDGAGTGFGDLDGIAATAGPGLIGGVLVGLVTGKALAAAVGLPLIAVNHLEGHALSVRLSHDLAFPYLLLLVTGGHCQLVEVAGLGRYRRLGTTVDDAVGEAFDKVARLLGLEFPGGPEIERAARGGDPKRYALPRPLLGREGCDFSFSGLKSAVRRIVEERGEAPLGAADVRALAASFQAAVADILADRTRNAMLGFADRHGARRLVVAGGVAANEAIRARLALAGAELGYTLTAPPPALCTDNAAMIAWAGVERLAAGLTDPLDAPGRARWPLDGEAA